MLFVQPDLWSEEQRFSCFIILIELPLASFVCR